jgi:hypothetical protein
MMKSQWKSAIKAFNDNASVPEEEWEINTRANMDRLHKNNSVWTMKDKFLQPNDKAVIIVGTSPCLKRDVKKLKGLNRDDFCIVCVNSALKFIMDRGIIPDYVVAFDSDEEDVFAHLDVDSSGLTLIASNILAPKVLDAWKGEILYLPYFAVKDKKLKRQVRNRLGKMIPIGGNALCTFVATAIQVWGARIIILVGNECCYKKDYYPYKTIARNNPVAPEFNMKDINGNKRVTTTALYTYKLWLEQLAVAMSPAVKIIDTSEGLLGAGKSYIYTYELSEIISLVKDATKKKREIVKDAESNMPDATMH